MAQSFSVLAWKCRHRSHWIRIIPTRIFLEAYFEEYEMGNATSQKT